MQQSDPAALETSNVNPYYPRMLADRLCAWGFPAKQGRLLDVGCGGGGMIDDVADRLGAGATGLDASAEAIDSAGRSFPDRRWICGQIEQGAVGDSAPFDGVTLLHVLEHLDDPLGALRVLRGWLRPGGLLVIEVPHGELFFSRLYSLLFEAPKALLAPLLRAAGRRVPFTARGFYPYHLTMFGVETLTEMVAKAGFEVLSVENSTTRLEYMLEQSRRRGALIRSTINRIKIGLARNGMGEILLLVARRPASR